MLHISAEHQDSWTLWTMHKQTYNGKFGGTHHNEGNSQGHLNIGEAWFLLNIIHNVDLLD